MTSNGTRIASVIAALALGAIAWDSVYVIQETEQGVLTHFGKVSPPVRQPGLHVKWPRPVSRIYTVDRRVHTLTGVPQELITEDQKSVLYDGYLLWRIEDPILFVEAIRTGQNAAERLEDLYRSSSGVVISNKARDAFIGLGLEHEDLREASREILARIAPVAKANYGIGVIKAGIVEYTLPPENRPSVIQRMISERARIATRYRSEGEEMAIRIEALAVNEHERIVADAHAEATAILGKAEAQAAALLGKAYREDPEFYKFIRALDSYEPNHRSEHDAHASGRQRAVQVPRQPSGSRRARATAMSELPPSTRSIHAGFDFFANHARRILRGVVAVAVLGVLASGFYIVKKEEQGVLTRFGRVVDASVSPGWHYAIPFVEQAHIRKVKRVVRHRIVSREGNTVNFTLLTGDTNLIEIDLALQFRIDNLKAWLFASTDPLGVLTVLVRERLVNVIGQNFIDLIFTSNRNIIERHLSAEVSGRLETLDVGVDLIALTIVDVRPIEETFFAFRDVSDAIAERAQAVSNANAKKERLLARTRGQAEAMFLGAKARAWERIVQAKAAADAFTVLLAEYRSAPTQVAITRYWQRMRTIFAEASLAVVNPGSESSVDINMIEEADGFIPAELALGMPTEGEAPDRPADRIDRALAPSTGEAGVHAMETVESDQHLVSGRFHRKWTERDHLEAANPRSLIFDSPSIFSHRHVQGRGGAYGQPADLRPMSEKLYGVDEGDGAREEEEGQGRHGARNRAR